MTIPRRTFIRAAGISLALPWLDAFAADPKPNRQTASAKQPPRRMVCVCAPLGLHPDNFFPEKPGKDYTLSPYLEILKEHRDDFTVVPGFAMRFRSTSSPLTISEIRHDFPVWPCPAKVLAASRGHGPAR